jgi:hypothetical protein
MSHVKMMLDRFEKELLEALDQHQELEIKGIWLDFVDSRKEPIWVSRDRDVPWTEPFEVSRNDNGKR